MENRFNLEEKINLIYNFIFNQIDDSCFKISNLNLKNISIDDIKIKNEYKEISSEIFDYIMEGKLQLKKKSKNFIMIKRFSDLYSFDIIIEPYKNYDKDMLLDNRDCLFSYILSKIVLDKKSSGILLPIINFDIEMKMIQNMLKSLDLYNFFNEMLINDKISSIFSFRLKENFDRSLILSEYLSEKEINFKYLLFQIIHVIAVIQQIHPTFCHNNLTLENIMIFEIIEEDKKFMFDRNLFTLKNLNGIIKIYNFSQSETSDFKNPKKKGCNKYSDLFTFLKSLHQFMKLSNLSFDNETRDFIDKIFPKEFRDKDHVKELFKPDRLLDDNYFKSLKISDNNLIEKKSSKPDYMKNLRNKNHFNKDQIVTNLDSETRSILGEQDKIDVKFKRIEVDKKGSKKLNRKLKHNQEGGFKQYKSPFNSVKNNPMVSNDAKDTMMKRKNEQPPPKEPAVLAEQTIYDVAAKKSEPVLPQMYPPAYVPVENPYYPNMNPQYAYGYKPNQIPVQKYYNITLSNPVGDHTTINQVYEDMIPGDKTEFTLASLFERRQFTNFFRSEILENGDGEKISISPGESKTLLSYIRLLELNPYNLKRNPYESLSKGFLLYNAAYPIRYNQEKNNLTIAKKATGINVRIYELSDGAMLYSKLSSEIDYSDFDVWREIRYYEFVRQEILKTKVSPNFVGMYLYTLDTMSRIDYSKIDMIKYKNQPKDSLMEEIDNSKKVNELIPVDPLELLTHASSNFYNLAHKRTEETSINDLKITKEDKKNVAKFLIKNSYIALENGTKNKYNWTETGIKYLINLNYYNMMGNDKAITGKVVSVEQIELLAKAIGKPDLTKNSNYSLIALTEAPNSNILQWGSPLIENYGAVKKMIETGYHTPKIWKSVLFQLVYSCAVLQKYNILFTHLSLENNFFVKDLYTEEGSRGHWIYMIDNFEFFIPNYGYLLMIDSRYVDIFNEQSSTIEKSSGSKKYKINSDILYPKNEFSDSGLYKTLIYNQFKSIIDPDNFRTSLEKTGGEKPDEEILKLLQDMYSYHDKNQNISDFIVKFFPMYLNNRVGTLLTKDEKDNLPLINNYNFKVGDLVAWEESYQQYKWVVIIAIKEYTVEVQSSSKAITEEVSKFSLNKYPEAETIKQKITDGINLDPSFTIETYNLKN